MLSLPGYTMPCSRDNDIISCATAPDPRIIVVLIDGDDLRCFSVNGDRILQPRGIMPEIKCWREISIHPYRTSIMAIKNIIQPRTAGTGGLSSSRYGKSGDAVPVPADTRDHLPVDRAGVGLTRKMCRLDGNIAVPFIKSLPAFGYH